jgi:large subunit ribosomal protein L4
MAEAQVLGSTEKVSLSKDVFGQPFNGPLVHECVIAELAARRQGTHSTKTRGKVSGGGAKPWRQKGTGRARAGSSRSPIWTGGGIVFGPTPRHYTVKVNRKARRAALRSALSIHAERGSLFVVDTNAFKAPSTKQAFNLIEEQRDRTVLLVLSSDGEELGAGMSFRNLPDVHVVSATNAGVADVVRAASLVVSKAAIKELEEQAAKPKAHAAESSTAQTTAKKTTSAKDPQPAEAGA